MAQDDYAILVAIHFYPGFDAPLHGPENDANDFYSWLTAADGGAVPQKQIERIYSSHYPPTADPYDASPTEVIFKQTLNRLLMQPNGREWKDRVGRRLYLFFAGHGFTAGARENPAIYTAQAQDNDTLHIAAYDYAMRIKNAAFFDEVVLIMDCCHGVLKASLPPFTTWTAPERPAKAAQVKMMQAYGAPRGLQAFEETEGSPPIRGYFTLAFMEALRTAPGDRDGCVWARDVEDLLLQLWSERYLLKTLKYEPPIVAPRELLLYRKPQATSPPSPPPQTGVPAAGPQPGLGASRRTSRAASLRAKTSVRFVAEDPGALIRVLDRRHALQHEAVGNLRCELAEGCYTARFRIGDEMQDQSFEVVDGYVRSLPSAADRLPTATLTQPKLRFSSPIPMPETSDDRLDRRRALSGLSLAVRNHDPLDEGTLLIVVRHGLSDNPDALQDALTLVRLDDIGEAHPLEVRRLKGSDLFLANFIVRTGTYLLGVKRTSGYRSYWQQIVLNAVSGWRTEVYMETVADRRGGWDLDIERAGILIVPIDDPPAFDSEQARLTEVARLALLEGRIGVNDEVLSALLDKKICAPMLALFTAYAIAKQDDFDRQTLWTLCANIDEQWPGGAADTQMLRARCTAPEVPAPELSPSPVENAVPCIAQAWDIPGRLDTTFDVPSSIAYSTVGLWRIPSELWTHTLIPTSREAIVAHVREIESSRLDPSSSDTAELLQLVTQWPGELAPFQQAIRRAILSAAESETRIDLHEVISRVSRTWAVDEGLGWGVLAALQGDSQQGELTA